MRILEGIVVSTQMNKTVVVEVFRKTPHPLYRKLIKRSRKFKADNTGFENLQLGSRVKITETRPFSKGKYFKISQVLAGLVAPVKKEETTKVEDEAEKPKTKPKVVKKNLKKIKEGPSGVSK